MEVFTFTNWRSSVANYSLWSTYMVRKISKVFSRRQKFPHQNCANIILMLSRKKKTFKLKIVIFIKHSILHGHCCDCLEVSWGVLRCWQSQGFVAQQKFCRAPASAPFCFLLRNVTAPGLALLQRAPKQQQQSLGRSTFLCANEFRADFFFLKFNTKWVMNLKLLWNVFFFQHKSRWHHSQKN